MSKRITFQIQELRILLASMLIFASMGTSMAQIKTETATTTRDELIDVKKIEKKNETAVPPAVNENEKQSINYEIIDMAPDMNFQPSPLPPSNLKNLPKNKYYDNYVEAGYGNLNHFWLDSYFNYKLKSKQSLGVRLNNHSTSGLKDYPYNVSTKYRKTYGELFLESPMKGGDLHVDVNFGQNLYNLYGSSFPKVYFSDSARADVDQTLSKLGGKITYETFQNKFFNHISGGAYLMNDRFKTKEARAEGKINLDITGYEASFLGQNFELAAEVPLEGSFDKTKFNKGTKKGFEYWNIGASPTAHLENDDWDLRLGIRVNGLLGTEKEYRGFYFFPRVEAEYRNLEYFDVFAGVDGGIQTNRYYTMLKQNLYLYPDQWLAPTVKKYEVYGGIQGQVNEQFSYRVKLLYSENENILFFDKKANIYDSTKYAFDKFNTFQALYDDGAVYGVSASVNYLQIENLNAGIIIDYRAYSLKNYDKILNTPNLRAQINGSYKFLDDKLILGTEMFFVGSRLTHEFKSLNSDNAPFYKTEEETLPSYFDLNINGNYEIKPFLNAFIKGINLLNSENTLYADYPMQGIQVLGGLIFKF